MREIVVDCRSNRDGRLNARELCLGRHFVAPENRCREADHTENHEKVSGSRNGSGKKKTEQGDGRCLGASERWIELLTREVCMFCGGAYPLCTKLPSITVLHAEPQQNPALLQEQDWYCRSITSTLGYVLVLVDWTWRTHCKTSQTREDDSNLVRGCLTN
jgi:hypothetical protein